eukprot:6630485-Lingulodinium_polyedra.AAC.1
MDDLDQLEAPVDQNPHQAGAPPAAPAAVPAMDEACRMPLPTSCGRQSHRTARVDGAAGGTELAIDDADACELSYAEQAGVRDHADFGLLDAVRLLLGVPTSMR